MRCSLRGGRSEARSWRSRAATRCWPGCGLTANRASSKWWALPSLSRLVAGGDARRQPAQVIGAAPGQAGQRGHHRGAVHDRQSFLGPQLQRRQAVFGQGFGGGPHPAAVQDLAFAAQHRGHVGKRGQVTAGADRTFGRDQRQDVVFKQGLQLAQQAQADARHALRQRGQARDQHGAGFFGVQETAQANAVVGVQAMRQFGDLGRRDHHRARIAVAGADAVDGAVFGDQAVDELGAAVDARLEAGLVRQPAAGIAAGQVGHVLDAQRAAVDVEGTGVSRSACHGGWVPRTDRS